MFRRATCLWRITAAWIFACAVAMFAETAVGDEQKIRHEMPRLGDAEMPARAAAVDALRLTNDPRASTIFQAYLDGNLYLWKEQLFLLGEPKGDAAPGGMVSLLDPLTAQVKRSAVPTAEVRKIKPSRRERKTIVTAILYLALYSTDLAERGAAAKKCGNSRNVIFVDPLSLLAKSDENLDIRDDAQESLWLIQLGDSRPDASQEHRLAAARGLGELCSARALPLLHQLTKELDSARIAGRAYEEVELDTYQQAVEKIESYQRFVHGGEYLFSGVSLGSVLILMALGLSITFGLMGVINMAHGELMMIGAYATYEVQQVFTNYLPEAAFNYYFIAALPVAFLAAAFAGFLIEYLVIRHLYGRPLDTLLATWGVSLILIQIVRVHYGNNIAVSNPTWLRGGVEIVQDVVLPYNRCFIIALCAACVMAIHALMKYTKFGLLVRATTQNRDTADSLGVNTRRFDGYTLALGGGIAGIAGYALTLIGGVTPDMGQNYIVDSFLVVVTGGVGEIFGAVWAGLGMGVINKMLEPVTGAVWGKVLILLFVVVFIQWRPAGLFPPKGRMADV